METYSIEEVKKLIEMLKSIEDKASKSKDGEPTPLEKQIRYLEQRHKFFNPSKNMLAYIISQAKRGGTELDPVLLEKLKEEFDKKES